MLIYRQPVSKRRIALLKSLKKTTEAISALNQFLDSSPTDAEAWAELSDLYLSQGLYQQAIFALEEVILITPYAWNVSIPTHSRQKRPDLFVVIVQDQGCYRVRLLSTASPSL